MPIKILIIDGSDFRNDLINILSKYNQSIGVEYDAIPNQEIPEEKIKTFIKDINNESYAMVFCHLRWVSEKIDTLDKLRESDWFQPIFQINNRIGVSNGSKFRDKARSLQLFKCYYSHKEAADRLEEILNAYASKAK